MKASTLFSALALTSSAVASVITSGVAGQTQPRLEVRQLATEQPEQWALFVLAMQQWQGKSQSEVTGYYQIASIHGVPRQVWDGVEACNGCSDSDGFGTHDSVNFPTWHRAYVALFEQELVAVAQTIADSYPEADKCKMQEAAAALRLPYWDWAAKAGSGSVLPTSISGAQITVEGPNGSETIDNPLYGYKFQDSTSDMVYSPFVSYEKTYRYPSTNSASATSQESSAVNAMDNVQENLQDSVYQMLSTCTTYDVFSNDVTNSASCSSSIEGIHNTVHSATGGSNGHMYYLATAAFDPIFFLHHSNVDRLFALWQAIHPDSYGASQSAPHTTWYTTEGETCDANTGLAPFRKDSSGTYWSSNDVRDYDSQLHYTYPEIVAAGGKKDAVVSIVNALYGPSATLTAGGVPASTKGSSTCSSSSASSSSSKAATSASAKRGAATSSSSTSATVTSGDKTSSGSKSTSASDSSATSASASASATDSSATSTSASDSSSASATSVLVNPIGGIMTSVEGAMSSVEGAVSSMIGGIFPTDAPFKNESGSVSFAMPTATGTGAFSLPYVSSLPIPKFVTPSNGSEYQYVANCETSRYALNGSYSVFLFSGQPSSETPSSWMTDSKMIGFLGFVAGGHMSMDLLASGAIPLTRTLQKMVSSGVLSDMSESVCVPWMKKNLVWRIVGPDGNAVQPDSVPGFKVAVYSSTSSIAGQFSLPSWSSFVPHWDVTSAKEGGASQNNMPTYHNIVGGVTGTIGGLLGSGSSSSSASESSATGSGSSGSAPSYGGKDGSDSGSESSPSTPTVGSNGVTTVTQWVTEIETFCPCSTAAAY